MGRKRQFLCGAPASVPVPFLGTKVRHPEPAPFGRLRAGSGWRSAKKPGAAIPLALISGLVRGAALTVRRKPATPLAGVIGANIGDVFSANVRAAESIKENRRWLNRVRKGSSAKLRS